MEIRKTCVSLALILSIFLTASLASAQGQNPQELNVIWHEGALGELLKSIGQEYTKETGVNVNIDLVPWSEWHDNIKADFGSDNPKYDLVIFDSQSMSEFASENDIVLLNPFLDKGGSVSIDDFEPASLSKYAQYPEGSTNYFALPLNQDTMGLVYRKDLFESPVEREKFQKTYGYDLKAPETYSQLKDIAEYFTRPDENLYGIVLFGSSDYDAVTSAFNNVLWSYGGKLWDAQNNKTEGVINSEVSVSALEYFKSLFEFAPPGASGWYYDEVNNAVNQGQVAMGINWYYFFNSYLDPESNKNAQNMGFATLPGEKDSDGKFRQYNSVGGQGIGISKNSENPEEAWKFLQWLMSNQVQWQWVNGGGQTGRTDILESPQYTGATPFNADFPISMSRVKDYWHLVEYPELLKIYQKYVHLAVTGEMSPKDALDNTAKEQQRILDKMSGFGIINIDSVARSLPPGGDSLVTDTRLIDREDIGIRVFRVNRIVPGHYHENSDTYLYITSGKAAYVLADGEPVVVGPGDFIYFKRGTNHEVTEILEEPFTVLAIDTPPRDPKDVVFQESSDTELIETK